MPRRIAPAVVAVALLMLAPAAWARDVVVSSFDGTPIVAHWFPQPDLLPGKTAPTVLMGPGWGLAGESDPASASVARLHRAGYNVLTWDPRGFGASGGTVQIDSAEFEGRDVQGLIDWVAGQPEVQLDAPGDPRMGMAGGSYGGGIQFVVAAIDRRVDAITPSIAWHSLGTSLYKDRTVKVGWAGLLYSSAAARPLAPQIRSAYEQGTRRGVLSAGNVRFFLSRGPAELVERVRAPTLILQGTVDTLFTLDEAVANYRTLRRRGVPVKMLWFCGGHGVCLTGEGDPGRVARATVAWLDRYVKRDASVDTGPRFDWIDQRGRRFTERDWPPARGGPLRARGNGTLRLVARGGAGPVELPDDAGAAARFVAGITPARAANAVEVRIRAPRRRGAVLVGAPRVRLTYRGRARGPRPARVFAQLVDDRTGRVLGNQITPIPLRLDGRRHTVTRPLEIVAHTLPRGRSVTLQLVATTVAYARPRLGGRVRFERIDVAVPTRRR